MTKTTLAARLLPLLFVFTALRAQAPPSPDALSSPTPEQAAALRNSIAADPANLQGERVSPQSLADTLPLDHGAPALEQLLLKLRTRASLMLIVAHPDDEDGGLLTFESRGQGARVAMLTLNRGEGGQNLMSADFNDALGLIRTQELLGEDRYTGTDQLFGTVIDFGFSKTKEEAFAQWTHDRVLYDAVRAVRLYRPLVLASVFVGGAHGRPWPPPDRRRDHPGGLPRRRQPQPLPGNGPAARGPPSRSTPACPSPASPPSGMFDYATGQHRPQPLPQLRHRPGRHPHRAHSPPSTSTRATRPPSFEANRPLGMEGLSYVQWARREALALQKPRRSAPNVRLAPAGRADSGYTLMATRVGCPLLRPRRPPASAPPVPAHRDLLL